MSEFGNRINAQRSILGLINSIVWPVEPLFGLSSKAIGRWVSVNQHSQDGRLVLLIRSVAAELFFLGNLSQEQITDEYSLRERAVAALAGEISDVIRAMKK